jgi:WD40 repeat protein
MTHRTNDVRDFGADAEVVAAGSERGERVRLSFVTWERVVAAAVVVALCVLFADDPPPVDDGTITLHGHSGLVESVRFSPDGQTLISSSWDRSVRLWVADRSSARPAWEETASLPSGAEMYGAAVSPDGGTVASAGLSGLTLWNWRDPTALPEVKPQFGPCRVVVFSPDGRTLAVGGFDREIRVWDLETDSIRAVLTGHRDAVREMAYVPDGSILISLSFDGGLKFWDTATSREIDRLDDKNRRIHTFSLSPDGGTLALSLLDTHAPQIELWDLATGRNKAICEGHRAGIHALVFSPDGRTLASAGGDRRIRFWHAETGRSAGEVDGELGWVRSLDFSKDGRWLAYSGCYNQVHIRRITLPNAAATAPNDSRPG